MYTCTGAQLERGGGFVRETFIKVPLFQETCPSSKTFWLRVWYICIYIACVSLANHLRAVTDAFCPFRTHQRYWTTGRWTSQKRSPSNRQHTACSESRKYISEDNQNAQNDESRAQPLIHVYIFFVILSIFKGSFYIFFETTWNYLNHATQWH